MAHAQSGPVTRDEYNALLNYTRSSAAWMQQAHKKLQDLQQKVDQMPAVPPAAGANPGAEQAVDLSMITDSSSAPAASGGIQSPHAPKGASGTPSQGSYRHDHAALNVSPYFKAFFDFNFYSRPGIADITFDNFHTFLLFEVIPASWIQFSFDVNPTPRYYEMDFQVLPSLTIRIGKIWIPFDDMSPHNIFGGRVNVSRLSPLSSSSTSQAFLPDLWTELGVGVKFVPVDTATLMLTLHAYVVNGIQGGGTDLLSPGGGSDKYPLFGPTLSSGVDNNRDKALGGRVQALWFRKWSLGASFYTDQWNSDSAASAQRLYIVGVDSQLRFPTTEFRFGYAPMFVGLPSGESFTRGGIYGEVGQKFGSEGHFKVLARGGSINLDDRVNPATTDQMLVGLTLLYQPNFMQYSVEFSQDLLSRPGKLNYSFLNFRVVLAL